MLQQGHMDVLLLLKDLCFSVEHASSEPPLWHGPQLPGRFLF